MMNERKRIESVIEAQIEFVEEALSEVRLGMATIRARNDLSRFDKVRIQAVYAKRLSGLIEKVCDSALRLLYEHHSEGEILKITDEQNKNEIESEMMTKVSIGTHEIQEKITAILTAIQQEKYRKI